MQTLQKERKKTLMVPESIYYKLGQLGTTNETYGQVIERLIRNASTNRSDLEE